MPESKRKSRPGPKPKSKADKQSVLRQCLLTPEEARRFDRIARDRKLSASALIRECILPLIGE